MTDDEVIQLVTSLPGVDVVTASAENGAPEVAWGDTFFFYDPERSIPADRRFPFATIVIQDYDGFDTASQLNRPGVFRVNVAAGRHGFTELFGYPPAEQAEHQESFDYAVLDQFIPHPTYAKQGWVSILNPTGANAERLRTLLTDAHAVAAKRHK